MTPTYLDDIVRYHRERANADGRNWQERLGSVHYSGPSMLDALRAGVNSNVKVIAEVKRRSPSKGWINEHLDAAQFAREYELGGASAISVLTDGPHFSGSEEDFAQVRAASSLPLLRKDFTVSANDVIDGAQMGASTVLLIVAALSDEELTFFHSVAQRCGMDVLVEVHDLDEARRAVDLGARIIGVNQRDLRTFDVNPDGAASVIGALPSNVVAVAESGLNSREDVQRAAAAGFDAVLVGESFVRSADPADAVRSFASVTTSSRG